MADALFADAVWLEQIRPRAEPTLLVGFNLADHAQDGPVFTGEDIVTMVSGLGGVRLSFLAVIRGRAVFEATESVPDCSQGQPWRLLSRPS